MMMAEPSKPTVQQIAPAANELSSSKTSTSPPGVRDRLNSTPMQPRIESQKPGDGRNMRGPRCITIQRSSVGFGFTLRHFIVYPPDSVSDCPEEWQRGMSAGLLDPMIPMDTIFVKHVRENGPAVKAGLSTGDQVVSVNGESVMCKSYAQVVQMIQKSGPNLQLVVMPKEHDVLQQCFADTAHNPYTNARPAVIPAVSDEQAGKMMMDPFKPNNIMSHLPRPKPYQPFQVETKKPVTPQTSVPVPASQPVVPRHSVSAVAVPLGRVLSPLVTAGTTTNRTSSGGGGNDDAAAAAAAAARLAAAAALVSKSVRKSADFNPNPNPSGAGSRGSLVDYAGSTTGFSAASKRSSYAGTATCKSEFIYSINNTSTTGISTANQAVISPRSLDTSNLPHHFHYPVHPAETAIHGSASSLQQQHRDSLNSSKGSLYSASDEQQSQQQAQVMTRIKKSFEQKEEFLKRPALPYWVNVQEAQQSPPVPKEFYAQPKKFAIPVWPPVSASSTTSLDSLSAVSETSTAASVSTSAPVSLHKNPGLTKTEVISTSITSMEPWSVAFTSKKATPPTSPSQSPGTVGLGLVPNTVPKPFVPYGSSGTSGSPSGNKQFVSTLTRIQENVPAEPALKTVPSIPSIQSMPSETSKPNRQLTLMHAPLASPEEFFTPSPTKAGQHPLAAAPSVVKRTKPFENGAEKGLLARIAQRGKQQQEASDRYGKPSAEFQRVPAGTGNRTVIIGSSKLHCQPPANEEFDYGPSLLTTSTSTSTSISTTTTTNNVAIDVVWNEEERKSLVLRQHSYRSAVRDFAASSRSELSLDENSNRNSSVSATTVSRKKRPSQLSLTGQTSPLAPTGPLSASGAASTKGPCLQTDIDAVYRSCSPLSLPRPSPIASDFELSVLERFDQLLAALGTSSGSSSISSSGSNLPAESQPATKMTSTPAATASVNRRQKIYDDDSDRGMRRISYLKATAGNPVDGTAVTESEVREPVATPVTIEHAAKGSSSSSWAVVKESVMADRVQPPVNPVGMISRLRQYFEDKSRPPPPVPIKAAASRPPPLAPSRRPAHQPHSIQKLRSLFGDKVATGKLQGELVATAAHPPSPSETEPQGREGWLYVKQTIIDCRRSTDRSWRQMWTRIRSGTVHFSKDRAANNSNNNNNNNNSNSAQGTADDMMIDLRGCTVEVALYYTKRKHVLRLSTFNGLCEYLMQCEDNNDMVLWLDSFQQEQAAANNSDKEDGPGSSYSSSEQMLVRQAHEAENSLAHGRRMGRFTLHRNRSPTGHSPVSKTRKPSLPGSAGGGNSGEPSPITPANAKPTTWRRKVVQQFKKIQGNSPNSAGLYHPQMIPEGATIGVPLEFCPRSSLSENIPLIVELCVGIVEARGLESVGVYRVPGNSVAVNALTDSLNRGFDGLNQSDPRWNDVNVISSLMKSFFRKLPDPLVTSELYGALIEASKSEPEQSRLNGIKRLVDELPEPHYSTLRYLVGHLSRVAAKSYINKMEARNLAIVFGPTLIRPGDDSTVTMVTDMSHQCRIVETLIDKVDFFFPPETDQVDQLNSPTTQASNSNLSTSTEDRKDAFAKEIVSSIISAARKKRQTSLDSPDLSDRADTPPVLPVLPVVPVVPVTSVTSVASVASVVPVATTKTVAETPVPTGSAHSLVELGSTGGQPALPVEASEFRLNSAEIDAKAPTLERKRSASLGGESVLPPPPNMAINDLAGITELTVDGAQAAAAGFRSRTSSGTFVVTKPHPIDAAGIRSYSGLSAVTQERIRLFEQETKAMLQRDLARQRREGEPAGARRLDKTEVETAWQRAKLEMETDDFLDVLADNPSEVVEPTVLPEVPTDKVKPEPEEPAVLEKIPEIPLTEKPAAEPETTASETSSVTQEDSVVDVTEDKSEKRVQVASGSARTTGRIVKSPTAVTGKTTPKPVSGGVVGRSQIPKPLATKSNESSPTKTASETPRTSPTKSTVTTPVKNSSRTTMAVVGRAKTVDLGKNTGKKTSVGELQAPRVVRQMSTGHMQPISPNRSLPIKANPRIKSVESPTKKIVTGSVKTEDTKKAATTTDGEQSKRLLESNLDEALNIPDTPKNGTKEAELAERPSKTTVGVKRDSKSGEQVSKGVKRSDSLTKDEKTESNTKAREREMRQSVSNNGQRPRKFVQRSGESGLKRRHTVGGTRDFDKVRIRWLADKSDERNVIPAPRWSAWDRLQPLISDEDLNVDRSLKTWMRSERMRTSSPELCRRSETASCVTPNTLLAPGSGSGQPLETSSSIQAGDASSP